MTPRSLHPVAWWIWAVALGAAAIRTTNPVLLLLIAGVAWYVVVARRTEAPWARSFGSFARLGAWIIVIRLVLEMLFGARTGGRELFAIPSVAVPDWMQGFTLGGPVTLESLVGGLYDGLQLAVLLACVGAANSLASPYRLLRSLPSVLYEAGVAVTVALSFAPQASASARRVQEARRLRGRPHKGLAGIRGMAMPVLEDALDRSLHLAASMDARGYGRRALVANGRRRATQATAMLGLLAVLVGTYGLLDLGSPAGLGLPSLITGSVLLVTSLLLGGARSTRTRYRPDPWRLPEWLTIGAGITACAGLILASHLGQNGLAPSTNPIELPTPSILTVMAILLAITPAFATPIQEVRG